MTLWIFSHKTFGSSTLGICRVTKDIHIKEGTTNYSQLFRPPQRRQDPPSIPSKNIGQRVKTTSDHLEWLRSRKETRLYRPRSSPIPVPVKNRRKEDLRFLLYEWHWGREGGRKLFQFQEILPSNLHMLYLIPKTVSLPRAIDSAFRDWNGRRDNTKVS